MALLVFVAAVLVHVPAVFIRGSAVRAGDSLAVNARTVSACWLLCHHRAVRPS